MAKNNPPPPKDQMQDPRNWAKAGIRPKDLVIVSNVQALMDKLKKQGK